MPLPLILAGIAVATGIAGAAKAVEANATNKEAKNISLNAEKIFNEAKKKLEGSRNRASASLTLLGQEKVDVLQKDMVPFVKLMKKIKNINMTEISGMGELSKLQVNEGTLAEMESMGSLGVKMASGIAEGTAMGAFAAFGAYSMVGWLGTAGTGTAIAGLSGAAATNATLAWLGGGTLAAGGLGVAGGTALLGGIVAGPALAVLGFAMSSKANENLEKARSNEAEAKKAAEEMGPASDACDAISQRADMFAELLKQIHTKFERLIDSMKDVLIDHGPNYSDYGQEEKNVLAMAFSLAVATKAVLDTPILNEDGSVTKASEDVYLQMAPRIAKVSE